ncbi:MAG TPA: glycosyltransferase family 4 protein [Bacteroidia bacterium]|jgi:glycosyltransferase involved in cell wall biosynthesis|nr:glycosyltransferase family 4 protein [Bacteroidia bacterium]HMU18831.1 glycosyltransferase family 4 protein [Bacteroidia bacterium]
MKEKVCYILSFHDRAVQYEWIIERAIKQGLNLHFIFLNPEKWHIEKFARMKKIPCLFIKYRSKKDIPRAVALIYQYLIKEKITVVHTHLFDANLAGLTAAWLAKVKKRIYTRHHSDFHHRFYPKSVRFDRYCNKMATDIVAISRIVYDLLIEKEKVNPDKIHLVHHGFEMELFSKVPISQVEELKEKYKTKGKFPVVGMISRYEESKGIQHVIPAFKQLLKKYPDALLVLANSHGSYSKQIKKTLEQIPAESYCEIRFEYNLFALYQLFDIFVHVPEYREYEAFGQVYVEALAAGIPSVFTNSGVAPEFIKNNENALVCDYKNSDEIYQAILQILSDDNLRRRLVENGLKAVDTKFSMDKYFSHLKKLYGYD